MHAQVLEGESSFELSGIRTISFLASGGLFLVVSAFFIDMRQYLKNSYLFIFWLAGIPLIAMSYILSLTRTIWVGGAMAAAAMFILFYRDERKILSRLGYSVILLASILLIFKLANFLFLPGVNVAEGIDERVGFMRHEDTFEQEYQSRETGMETELELWRNSSIIWGVGACYPPSLAEETMDVTGALGHVAFSTYLAHFGLIGLFTYGLLLPFLTIRVGRRYYLKHKHDFGGVIAVTAIALSFFDFFTLVSSVQYLIPTTHVMGLIYGALWGLSRSLGDSPSAKPLILNTTSMASRLSIKKI